MSPQSTAEVGRRNANSRSVSIRPVSPSFFRFKPRKNFPRFDKILRLNKPTGRGKVEPRKNCWLEKISLTKRTKFGFKIKEKSKITLVKSKKNQLAAGYY